MYTWYIATLKVPVRPGKRSSRRKEVKLKGVSMKEGREVQEKSNTGR